VDEQAMSASDDRPVRLGVIGAGIRGGDIYGGWCLRNPTRGHVVAVADPDPARREVVGRQHGVPAERRHATWPELLAEPDGLDAVIVATPDHQHVDVTVAALEAGLDVLLEKPIAPDPAGLEEIRVAALRSDAAVTVAHVLRYSPLVRRLVDTLRSGAIGQLRGIEHAENVGYWHFAHSYVRGRSSRSDRSGPLILTKGCHDLDLIRWLADAPCASVTSHGHLGHFHAANAPAGAPRYCLDGCPVEETCAFHAGRYYVDVFSGRDSWSTRSLTDDPSDAGRLAALRRSPLGRCVYRCDNDVVDHQVAVLTFEGGVTATMTVTAFSAEDTRTVRLFGTLGELRMHLTRGELTLPRFLPAPHLARPSGATDGPTPRPERPATVMQDLGIDPADAHGSGDAPLMLEFTDTVRRRLRGDRSVDTATSLERSLESHDIAFAAEESRREGRTVALTPRAACDPPPTDRVPRRH
jgi:predicted dehydrogenase